MSFLEFEICVMKWSFKGDFFNILEVLLNVYINECEFIILFVVIFMLNFFIMFLKGKFV